MTEDEELEAEEPEGLLATADDVAAIAGRIAAAEPAWKADQPVTLGASTWRPHLLMDDGSAVLYVHLSARLRSFAADRLAAAFSAGLAVHVAVSGTHLFDEELLAALGAFDAVVHVVDTAGDVPATGDRLLAVLADRQIAVTPAARSSLAGGYLKLCVEPADNHTKGQRFEALLAFLFGQIQDFVVRERNFRTETEEIDLVVQQRATQGRVWATLMAPFILIEAKNRQDGVSQQMTSAFLVKILGKRGTVRVGFMCSTTTVSGDALTQELRFSSNDVTIVFLDYGELEDWCAAADGDDHLEELVTKAMLR